MSTDANTFKHTSEDIAKMVYYSTKPPCKTGSRYICDPPVIDTDEDWIVYVPTKHYTNTVVLLRTQQFKPSIGDNYADNRFTSFKRKQLNIIITNDKLFFKRFKLATSTAKQANVTNKHKRILLFKIICDNHT